MKSTLPLLAGLCTAIPKIARKLRRTLRWSADFSVRSNNLTGFEHEDVRTLHGPRQVWRLLRTGKSALRQWAAALALCVLLASPAKAQNQFYVTFRGTVWRTNSLGNLTPYPITEQDLLLAAAKTWGRSDATGLYLVYHVQGSSLGDTIDVVDSSGGSGFYLNYFGFYFGEATQSTPDRVALTNSTGTMVRRIDHIYTQTATFYTSPNPGGHDMGTGFITKRFMKDSSGNPRGTMEGEFYWLVRPQTNIGGIMTNIGGMMCKGTFTTPKPFP